MAFSIPAQMSLTIYGTQTAVLTEYVPGSLLSALYGLPVVGAFVWGCSMEQHPTGAINLSVSRSAIANIRSLFKKGTELEIANIGFSVQSYKEKLLNTNECPSGSYEVQISLTGKWDAPRYQKSVFLRPGVQAAAAITYQDPECTLVNTTPFSTNPTQGFPISSFNSVTNTYQTTTSFLRARQQITLSSLAASVGASFSGSTVHSDSDWYVEIPPDTPRTATVEFMSEVRDRLRQHGCFLDLCDSGAVKAKTLNTPSWAYYVPELEVACSGDTKNSPGHLGYAAEYPNTKLEGPFLQTARRLASQDLEDIQGSATATSQPNWKLRSPVTVTLTSGSVNPTVPYDNTTALKTLSHNWDTSGDTKTLRSITTEDGMPVLEEEWIYGFAYTSFDIVQASSGLPYGDPASYWKIVQYKRTEYHYHPGTGYALGSTTTGWKLGRSKTETDESFEAYNRRTEPAYLNLYKFRQISVTAATQYVLKQFSDYYKDASRENPPYEIYKKCLSNGSSVLNYKLDPTYVTPMFISEELTYTNSFDSKPNPDFVASDPTSSPYLITGEESFVCVRRQILPSANTTNLVGTGKGGDRYIEYRMESSAQNSGFDDKALRESFEEHEGPVPSATRKPTLYERVQPELSIILTPADAKKSEYRICTPGYSTATPSSDSYNAPYAKTLDKALTAAKTELKLQDIQQSVQFSANIPFNAQIRPLDRVAITTELDGYATRVVSFQNSLLIEGQLNGYPFLTAPEGTSVTFGIDRNIPVALDKHDFPSMISITLPPTYVGLTLGNITSPSLTTRRNF